MKANQSPTNALIPPPTPPLPSEKERGKQQVGPRLEKLRKRLGYSLTTVSIELGIDERALDAYEIGLRLPPDTVLLRLAEFYDTDVLRIVGEVDDARPTDAQDVLWVSWAEIRLEPTDPNHRKLRRIASSLRSIRGLAEDAPVVIRTREIAPLTPLLDIDDPDLRSDLQRAFSLDESDADKLAALLWYERQRVKELPS